MAVSAFSSGVPERQSIARKGVRAIDARIHSYEMAQVLQTSVRAPGLSAEECEHPFV